MKFMGHREACRFFNVSDVPIDRHLSHPVIRNWIRAGYVRAIPPDKRGMTGKVNVMDLVPCVIAQRAGKRHSGKQLFVSRLHKPASYTDPRTVRRLHDRMVAAGFPPVLEFSPESPAADKPVGEVIRARYARGVSRAKLAKSFGVRLAAIDRAILRKGRYADAGN